MMSRRGVTIITNSKASMVWSRSIMGNLRGLSTTVRRDERYFTKKHEWVEVEGTKGQCKSYLQYLILVTLRHGGHI